MKKFILLNLVAIVMMSSAQADMEGYEKIAEADAQSYFTAIKIALKKDKKRFNSTTAIHAGIACESILGSRYTAMYIDKNLQQPLLIAEQKGISQISRVTIQTDSTFQSILSMRYSEFSLSTAESNDKGSLAKPKIEYTSTWSFDMDVSCIE